MWKVIRVVVITVEVALTVHDLYKSYKSHKNGRISKKSSDSDRQSGQK